MKAVHIALWCLVLSGCGSASTLGADALARGDAKAAEGYLRTAVSRGENDALNNLGVAYARQGKRKEAIEAYTLAARRGDATARQNLTRLGLALPPVDMLPTPAAASSHQDAAGAGLALQFLNSFLEGKNRTLPEAARSANDGYPATLNCETRDTRMGQGMGGSIYTTCR